MVPNICKSPTEPWFWGALKLVAYPAYPKISQDIPRYPKHLSSFDEVPILAITMMACLSYLQ